MAGQKFARLIRAQDTTPEGLAAAIAAGSGRAERSLAVALYQICNPQDQAGFKQLVRWTYGLVEQVSEAARPELPPAEQIDLLQRQWDALDRQLQRENQADAALDLSEPERLRRSQERTGRIRRQQVWLATRVERLMSGKNV